jgi:hypothetical protein
MSITMLKPAWEAECETVAMKCLLVALADHYNDATKQCNPGIKRLMKMTSMSNRAVINNYEKLEKGGFITITRNSGEGVRARSNSYELHLKESERGSQRLDKKVSEPHAKESEPHTEESERGSPEPLRTLIKPLQNQTPKSDKSNQAESSADSMNRWLCVYPKKGNQKAIEREWNKLKPDPDLLIADTEKRKASDRKWLAGYVPNPENYLRDERYNDPIEPVRKSEAEPSTILPRDDQALESWAVAQGIHERGNAPLGMDYSQYRQWLQRYIQQHNLQIKT